MNIIDKIDRLRTERGWSVYELALEAGITQSTLASMSQRHTPPKIETLRAICDAFGITLAQFFLEDEKMEILTDEEQELINSFRKLPKEKQDALIELIK